MEDQGKYCENCQRLVKHNADLHIIQCKKYTKLCVRCKEPVAIDDMTEHLKSMHTIEVCNFCKVPYERWELEKHTNDCFKKPVLCKFCNLDVAADDFKEHAKACWNRTEKCTTCSQYIKLKDMENHEKTCQNPSMRDYLICKFCGDSFLQHVIETHESVCGDKTARCHDCGELIRKYKNNHACKGKKDSDNISIVRCISCNIKIPRALLATHLKDCPVNTNNRNSTNDSVRSGEVNGQDRNRDAAARPFNNGYRSPHGFPKEPAKNQATEISPPVQRDLSDPALNRRFREEDSSVPIKCGFCKEYIIPEAVRIHPEICPMRLRPCLFCENDIPYCILKPELHQCPGYPVSGNHKSERTVRNENGRQEMYASEYRDRSSFSEEVPKIQTQECPLCLTKFPADRFNTHVRACAEGKQFCYFCKNYFYVDMKEHMRQCREKAPETKKGSKKKANNEKNEGLLTRGWNYITSGPKKGKKGNLSTPDLNPENQLVIDGIPCEFCKELYPFSEIAVHELGCMHEEEMKKNASKKKPKDEVLQASGYTPYDPRNYMITDPYENKDKDREYRNQRFSQKSPKDVSTKFSYSDSNKGTENVNNHPSNAYPEDFYERHLVKDHSKDTSAGKSQIEPRKAVEEGKKKKDVIFTYTSETRHSFPVKEKVKTFDQGARPKYSIGEYRSKNYSDHKGLNCLSDSDEETDLCQSKAKDVNLENKRVLSSDVNAGDLKLNAIGYERKEKKSSNESEDKNFCISNGNDKKSSLEDASSCIGKKKGSFNSDSSEEVYLSCDEGEAETRLLNRDAKLSKNEKRGNKERENCSIEKNCLPNEIPLQKFGISMDDLEKYLKAYKEAKVSKNDENTDGKLEKGSAEMECLSDKEDGLQKHRISLNDFDKYTNESQNGIHRLQAIDSITSKSSTILSLKETHSLVHKYTVDDVEMECEADKKNEETFASDPRVDPFAVMTSSKFSYETISNLPPYSSLDSGCPDSGAVGTESEDNLDAYLQFLGVSDREPDANYRLFGNTQAYDEPKPTEPDLSYACGTNTAEPKMSSVPREPSVEAEELRGVSKNMSTYNSPFLLENECDEVFATRIARKFPVPYEEEKMEQVADKSGIKEKVQTQEEKDNELNLRLSWRSHCQVESESE